MQLSKLHLEDIMIIFLFLSGKPDHPNGTQPLLWPATEQGRAPDAPLRRWTASLDGKYRCYDGHIIQHALSMFFPDHCHW